MSFWNSNFRIENATNNLGLRSISFSEGENSGGAWERVRR